MPFFRYKIILLDFINPNKKLRRVQGKMLLLKFVLVCLLLIPSILCANDQNQKKLNFKIKSLVNNGSVLVANDQKVLYLYPPQTNLKLIPASVLKLATALAAKHYLGLDFQFSTDFFLSKNKSLIIRGSGDPFLVSETWKHIAKYLSKLPGIPKKLKKLSFDTSLFGKKIKIPGIKLSRNPYDARNGAVVVNFNTVFLRVASNGRIFSAEKQTPLTPLARRLGKKLSTGSHRISLPHGQEIFYAGEVIRAFLGKVGFSFDSHKTSIKSITSEDHLIYTYINKISMSEIIAGMMRYSNNFTANQLLLSIGLERYGAPSTLRKGNMAIREYLGKVLKISPDEFVVVEGSGISRKNRLTSKAILFLLKAFSAEQHLLNNERGIYLKTGTLRGVYTIAGYLPGEEKIYFVILLNQQKNNRDKILDLLLTTDFTESNF